MNKNYLIKTVSLKEHESVMGWYRNSIALFFVLCCAFCVVEFREWKEYSKVAYEKSEIKSKSTLFDSVMDRKQKLKKEEVELRDKINTLANYTHNFDTSTLFVQLNSIQNFKLSAVSKQENSIVITGNCYSTHDATAAIQKVSQLSCFKQIKLSSLNPKTVDNKILLQLTLKGTLKK